MGAASRIPEKALKSRYSLRFDGAAVGASGGASRASERCLLRCIHARSSADCKRGIGVVDPDGDKGAGVPLGSVAATVGGSLRKASAP